MMNFLPFFSIFCVFIGAPTIVFSFIYLSKNQKNDLVKLNYQKQLAELELEKEKTRLVLLAEENRKYDMLIDQKISNTVHNGGEGNHGDKQ